MGWWGSSRASVCGAVEGVGISPLEGPMVFVFFSVFDCASRALENLGALSVALSVSLCQSAETGLGFILCFSFRMRTRGHFSCTWTHSQNLSTTQNPLKILITFD